MLYNPHKLALCIHYVSTHQIIDSCCLAKAGKNIAHCNIIVYSTPYSVALIPHYMNNSTQVDKGNLDFSKVCDKVAHSINQSMLVQKLEFYISV